MLGNNYLGIFIMVKGTGAISLPAFFAIYSFSVNKEYDIRIIFK
jgi:hypothetical protein